MLRLASDEDVHGDVVRGLWRQKPDLDLVRVQDEGRGRTPDPLVLEWAAKENRVLITQDRSTLVGAARDRVRAGEGMPGVLALRPNTTIGEAVEGVLLIAQCYAEEEMKDQVIYVPL